MRREERGHHGPPRRNRTLVLTGGGTGGHLYPAVSIARALLSIEPLVPGAGSMATEATSPHRLPCTFRPVFIGSRSGIEAVVIPREGFEFHAVASRKVSKSLAPGTVFSLAAIAWGTLQAASLLRRLDPIAVIGTGGFASAGVVLAAVLQGIPTLIHEQNAVPGRTNRLLGRLVRRIALTFPEASESFPSGKTVLTGLPVRSEILAGKRSPGQRRPDEVWGLSDARRTLLVLGGSLGARSLNRAVLEALPHWANSGLQILHQVGKGNWEEHQSFLSVQPPWYHAVPYLDAMGEAYAAADLVLCRAGASTLSEVVAVGLPAILVPYPHAHADHQTRNALALVSAGAALLLPDADLSGSRLAREVHELLEKPERMARMAQASSSMGRPDAAASILRATLEMVGLCPQPESGSNEAGKQISAKTGTLDP